MSQIIFESPTHEDKFYELLSKVMDNGYYLDNEIKALMYLVALIEATKPGYANKMFDFKHRHIKPECIHDAWQTGSTLRTTRLAFSLWNGFPNENQEKCNVYNVFGYSYWDRYYIEAINLRYEIPHICEDDDE